MKKEYPSTVCLSCLRDAMNDTYTYHDRQCLMASCYSVYITKCEVCGLNAECTEPRDAGYPSFDYAHIRLRKKKIEKIKEKVKNKL